MGRGLVAVRYLGMPKPRTPHFDFPFRFDRTTGQFATVEQDTFADVFNCVHVTVRTHPGQRDLLPEFGVLDLTFMEQPVDTGEMQAEIARWEPRAQVVFTQAADELDMLIARVSAYVQGRGASA